MVLTEIMGRDVQRNFGKSQFVFPSYYGIDSQKFSPAVCGSLRAEARRSLGLRPDEFLILMLSNDLVTKGLRCLLGAVQLLQNPSIRIIVAGHDDSAPYHKFLREHSMTSRLHFLPIRPDVEFYYAAADLYAGPSLYDGYPLPLFGSHVLRHSRNRQLPRRHQRNYSGRGRRLRAGRSRRISPRSQE